MTTQTASGALLLVVVVFFILFLAKGYQDCRRQGGHYVRGLFWMECIR